MNVQSQPDSASKSDDRGESFFVLLGFGILLLIRWPFTSLWKKRQFDYDSHYPIPKSDMPYRLLCAFGAFVEVMLVVLPLSRWLDGVYAPIWAIWVAGFTFLVLTGIRIYLYGRNESEG